MLRMVIKIRVTRSTGEEIGQQRVPLLGFDRLRMKLYGVNRQRFVLIAHDFVDTAICQRRPSGEFEVGW